MTFPDYNPLRLLLLTLIAAVGMTAVSSCISDDITYSSSARLTFSTDTVSFDTVFTDVGTPTARLIVFNPGKQGVSISHIGFRNPSSRFSLNVDGVSGKTFSDVEIRGGDSIYIFIECLIEPTDGDTPVFTDDQLEFLTNGNLQQVQVEAWGQNVNRLRALTVDNDMTLTAARPYVVFDSLVVAPGATLTIEPGARVLFHDKAELIVHGRLNAIGEVGKMIHMRGDRIDDVLPDVGYDIMAGQWTGVRFTPESFDNRMEYVDLRSTRRGIEIDSTGNTERIKLLLRNSWLHNSQQSVLKSAYARVDAYGVCFSESAGAVVSLTGGEHTFVQCTLANNYLFSAVSEPLLSLFHCLPEKKAEGSEMPLMKASFENSIIYGLAADINEDDLAGSDVYLRNVLLKAKGTDDEHFISCVWDSDPLFYTERLEYIFNYRLRPDSPAIGKGNPGFIGQESLYDMDGYDRLGDGNPTLGAYVFRPADQTR